jgi:PAS domain S-box-containing protein
MIVRARHAWLWDACATAGTIAAFTLYLALRGRLSASPTSAGELVLVVAGVVLVGLALVLTWTSRRRARKLVEHACQQIAFLREDPAGPSPRPLPSDLAPLAPQLDALADSYRRALANLADQADALEERSQANARLQRINRDLERLKESYRDLYHNAPGMYFSLDHEGRFVTLNETMMRTLGYTRAELSGQPYTRLLAPECLPLYFMNPTDYQQPGEVQTRWVKKDGTVIDVWIRSAPVVDLEGRFVRSRSAAQDMTEHNRLANALRTRAEELQKANTQLRRINRELDEFTHVVSHDLKEPLRTIQAFSNFLAKDYGDKLGTEGKDFIAHLIQASRRLGSLIDDLLTLSKAGRISHSPQPFNLDDVVQTVCGDLADLIQRKGAAVRVDGILPSVAGDPQRITQLLTNLVSNGLKYNNDPHPEVTIGTSTGVAVPRSEADAWSDEVPLGGPPEPGFVTLFVRDNGIGIDPQHHQRIFRIFCRLHRREEYDGTGAGLAICKKILEAHGGRIWVDSQLGHGATFYFTLPRPRAREGGVPTATRSEPLSGIVPGRRQAPEPVRVAAAAGG